MDLITIIMISPLQSLTTIVTMCGKNFQGFLKEFMKGMNFFNASMKVQRIKYP